MAGRLIDAKHILWKTLSETYASLGIDITVMTTYPRTIQQLDSKPVITISRASDVEDILLMNDLFTNGTGYDTENLKFLYDKGVIQTETFEVRLWANNADLRDDLHVLTKQILQEKKQYMNMLGLIKFQKISGRDEELDLAKIPRTIYSSVLIYSTTCSLKYESLQDLVAEINVTTNVPPGDPIP